MCRSCSFSTAAALRRDRPGCAPARPARDSVASDRTSCAIPNPSAAAPPIGPSAAPHKSRVRSGAHFSRADPKGAETFVCRAPPLRPSSHFSPAPRRPISGPPPPGERHVPPVEHHRSSSPPASLVLTLSFGVRSVFGVMLDPISESFGWPREIFSLSMAIGLVVMGLGQPVFGWVADRFGDRLALWIGFALYLIGMAHDGLGPDAACHAHRCRRAGGSGRLGHRLRADPARRRPRRRRGEAQPGAGADGGAGLARPDGAAGGVGRAGRLPMAGRSRSSS